MKTAEEWYKENNISGECFALLTRSDIKEVQLDAFKAGMTEAATYIVEDGNPLVAKERILTARDNKTTL